MLSQTLPFAALLCGASACATVHVDNLTGLFVKVKATTMSDTPVEGAEVLFIDTGLDQYWKNRRPAALIGRTDEQGVLTSEYLYRWGYSYRGRRPQMPSDKIPGTFILVFRRDGMKEVTQSFNLGSLERQDQHYKVEAEIVFDAEAAGTLR